MELRQIECFIAVAEELSFRKAAERLFMTQPPLSRQIKQLEQELNTLLFNREKQRVTLTYSGKILYQKAKDISNSVEQARDALKFDHENAVGLLRIDLTFFGISKLFPEWVRQFRTLYPKVKLLINDSTGTRNLKDKLLTEETDIILSYEMKKDPRLTMHTIEWDTAMFVLPSNHPLANEKVVSLNQLKDDRFILFPRHLDSILFDAFVNKCTNLGFSPNIEQTIESMWKRTNLCSMNLGITISGNNFSQFGIQGVKYVTPAPEDGMEIPICITTNNKNDNPYIKKFMDIVNQSV